MLLGLKPSRQHPERKGLFCCCRSGCKLSRTPDTAVMPGPDVMEFPSTKGMRTSCRLQSSFKGRAHPEPYLLRLVDGVRRWFEFRNLLAAPAKGFKSAADSLLMIQRKFRNDDTHTHLTYSREKNHHIKMGSVKPLISTDVDKFRVVFLVFLRLRCSGPELKGSRCLFPAQKGFTLILKNLDVFSWKLPVKTLQSTLNFPQKNQYRVGKKQTNTGQTSWKGLFLAFPAQLAKTNGRSQITSFICKAPEKLPYCKKSGFVLSCLHFFLTQACA